MDTLREKRIVELARLWLARQPRTHAEILAYADGVEDALIAAYEDTMRGAYVAHDVRAALAKVICQYCQYCQ